MILKLICIGILAGSLVDKSNADSLLENGDFAKPLKPWKVFSLKDTPATENTIAEGVLSIKAAGSSDTPAARQMVQVVAVESGKHYQLEFDAKASLEGAKELTVVLVHSKDPKKGSYGLWRKVELTPEWKTSKLKFEAKEIEPEDPPILKFLMGKLKGDISFRKVILAEVEGG